MGASSSPQSGVRKQKRACRKISGGAADRRGAMHASDLH
jgi:hypothetical protein